MRSGPAMAAGRGVAVGVSVVAVVAVLAVVSAAVAGDAHASHRSATTWDSEEYTEEASLITLRDGSVLLRVEPRFRVRACAFGTARSCGTTLAPLPLRRLVRETGVDSVALRLTQGRWRDDLWGSYPHNKLTPVSGAEIEATWPLHDRNATDLHSPQRREHTVRRQHRFDELTHALAGIHCASLSTMGGEHVVVDDPLFTRARNGPGFTMRGVLQREPLCTENLTPLQHLLPCGRVAGIAAMFDSRKLFKGSFQSLGWTMVPSIKDSNGEFVDIHVVIESVSTEHTRPASLLTEVAAPKRPSPLTLGAFFSTSTWSASWRCAAAAVTGTAFTVDTRRTGDVLTASVERQGFHLANEELGQQSLQRYTLVNASTDAVLRVNLRWEPHRLQQLWRGHEAAAVNTRTRGNSHAPGSKAESSCGVTVAKVHLGRGTCQGAISTRIHNHNTNTSVKVRVLEMFPWQLNVFVSTRTVSVTSLSQHQDTNRWEQPEPFSDFSDTFVPARAQHRAAVLTTVAVIPAASTLDLSIHFRHGFLRSSDYPSDPFRGLEVLPSIVLIEPVEEAKESAQQQPQARLVSNALAIHMAVPDMSMPYNVIMLTSTAVAILFSMLLTLASNLRLPKLKP